MWKFRLFSLFSGLIFSAIGVHADCAKNLTVKSFSSQMTDSSGEVRNGVIAYRPIELNWSIEIAADMLSIHDDKIQLQSLIEAPDESEKALLGVMNTNISLFNYDVELLRGTQARENYRKIALELSSSMFFCANSTTGLSGNMSTFHSQECVPISNVVGIRLKPQMMTEGASIVITSLRIDGTSIEHDITPLELMQNQVTDICLAGAQTISVITVTGGSTNPDGSRGSLAMDVLVGEPL